MNFKIIATIVALVVKYGIPAIKMLLRIPTWVKEAQAAHQLGHEKLAEVIQKAVDYLEAQIGEIPDETEGLIVEAVTWVVDIALDMFKNEDKDEAFVKPVSKFFDVSNERR